MTTPIKTIFLAHDQQESPEARRSYLEHAGYRVRTFSNYQALMAAFLDDMPACVIIDALLEGKNGFETVEEIHRSYSRRPFPVMLCSRLYRGRAFREEARRCGASAFVPTPISLEELLHHVHQAIQNYQPSSGELDLAA